MAGEQKHPSSSRPFRNSALLRQHFRLRAQGRRGCVLTIFVVSLVAVGATQSFVVVVIAGPPIAAPCRPWFCVVRELYPSKNVFHQHLGCIVHVFSMCSVPPNVPHCKYKYTCLLFPRVFFAWLWRASSWMGVGLFACPQLHSMLQFSMYVCCEFLFSDCKQAHSVSLAAAIS